jgi:hypothetical protein
MAITAMGGSANLSTGLIHAVRGKPEDSQTTISESRYQRESVIRIADKYCQRQQNGQVTDGTKSKQCNYSFGGQPASSRIAQQSDQLRGHQDREQSDEHTGGGMGEFPNGGALMNHGETGRL